MNQKKIAFIMCANDEQYEQEARHYIKRLRVPMGYETEMIVIHGAKSMTEGYNRAMQQTDAKYKIYLHQDVMIIEQDFLANILKIFENREIGMIGMVGSPRLPENGVMWYGRRIGCIYSSSAYFMVNSLFGNVEGEYQQVEAVDGLMMITQYDIAWREDLFKKWDFYDISQCQEFQKKGYQIIVPNMQRPWCIHDCGAWDLKNYFVEREIFIREYKGAGHE